MRLLQTAACCLLVAAPLVAQDKPPDSAAPKQANPFDLSAVKSLIGTDGIPTAASVATLEQQAQAAVAAGDCNQAVELLDKFAHKANALANLIGSGLQPYYDASYDSRKGFSYFKLSGLVPAEKLANEYRAKRNHAMIMQAECFTKLGETDRAVQMYFQALNLTSIDDAEWWDRAKTELYALLGVKVK